MNSLGFSPTVPSNFDVINHFYCDITNNTSIDCLSFSQFVASPLDQLCPTKNCLEACQNLELLYEVPPLRPQIEWESNDSANTSSDLVTLYGLCAGYANISQALSNNSLPLKEAAHAKTYFPSTTESDLRNVTGAVTTCLSDTCSNAVDSSSSLVECSPGQLVLNGTTPHLLGAQECFKKLCKSTSGLPFGNQDVVGPGVSAILLFSGSSLHCLLLSIF